MAKEGNRRGLTPFRIIVVYAIALVFVFIHEMDRLATWVIESSLDSKYEEQIASACRSAQHLADVLGVGSVVAAENHLLKLTDSLPNLGGSTEEVQVAVTDDEVRPAANSPLAPPESEPVAGGDSPEPEQPLETPALEEPRESETEAPVAPDVEAPPVEQPHTEAFEVATARMRPQKILIAGDSMMLEGFGPALQRMLEKKLGVKVYREGKYSSGLSRPDFFDWNSNLQEILTKYNPDLLIMSLGANDPQDILDSNNKRHIVATESWNEIYAERGRMLLTIPEHRRIQTVWVGLPIMGNKAKYNNRIENLNRIMGDVCRENPWCHFVDAWYALANEQKKYTTFLKVEGGKTVRIRAKDNIHLTDAGGSMMADFFIRATGDFIDWSRQEPQPAEGVAADLSNEIKK